MTKQKFPVMGLLLEREAASGNDFAFWVCDFPMTSAFGTGFVIRIVFI